MHGHIQMLCIYLPCMHYEHCSHLCYSSDKTMVMPSQSLANLIDCTQTIIFLHSSYHHLFSKWKHHFQVCNEEIQQLMSTHQIKQSNLPLSVKQAII